MAASLAKNSFFNVLYQLVLVVVPLISAMYVSRVVLPDGLGEIAKAENLVSYFTSLAPLGIPAYGLREVAKARKSVEGRSKVFTELLLMNGVSTLLFLAVYAMCVIVMFGGAVPALYLIFGSLIVANCLNVEWLFSGMEKYVFISVRGMAVRVASLVLTLVFVKGPNDVYLYAAIICLATVANYAVNVVCIHGLVRLTWHGLRPLRHMKPVLILAGTIVLFSVYTKVDVTMLGMFCSSAVVAYYAYAYRAEEIAKMLCVSITSVYLPRMSYEFAHDRAEFLRLVRQSMMLNVCVSLPMAVGVFALAPHIVPLLFGEAFLPAVLTLRMFALLIVAKSVGNVVYQTTIAAGRERFQIVAYSIGVAVNIVLNLALIPVFQQNGAVVATVATETALDLVLMYFIREHMRLDIPKRFWASTFAGLLAMSLALALCAVLVSDHLVCTVISAVMAVSVYTMVGIVCRNETVLLLARKVFPNLK